MLPAEICLFFMLPVFLFTQNPAADRPAFSGRLLDEQELSRNDRCKLKYESETSRSKGIALADEICRKYRREGRYFDEILNASEEYILEELNDEVNGLKKPAYLILQK